MDRVLQTLAIATVLLGVALGCASDDRPALAPEASAPESSGDLTTDSTPAPQVLSTTAFAAPTGDRVPTSFIDRCDMVPHSVWDAPTGRAEFGEIHQLAIHTDQAIASGVWVCEDNQVRARTGDGMLITAELLAEPSRLVIGDTEYTFNQDESEFLEA